MSEKYDHTKIEKKWQKEWEKGDIFKADDTSDKEKYYLLVEFPYPSGNLHVGHWYAFSVPDIYARYLRMTGKNVLFPIGFDAFGLPAENAAIKRGLNPRVWTYDNMDQMRKQIRSMGASFDWSREVVTCDPNYYRWTQWQFIELYKRGLVYRKETAVNWCPNDKTVLANEQVIAGHCERCGFAVEQRLMPQWNIKITDYADRLIDDLAPLNWPEPIKDSQRNWIGRSDGVELDFELTFTFKPAANENRGPNGEKAHLTVFTTRADTLFGATYLVLAPEHLWVTLATDDKHDVLENKDEVKKYVESAKKKTELERAENKEKTGVEVKGVKAINPANGEQIPIFVADYVLGNYGTGAIMAVPAHDDRDFAFAKKFNVPIISVVNSIFHPTPDDELVKNVMMELVEYAQKNDKRLIISGGWAVEILTGRRIRPHDDIDVCVWHLDASWWQEKLPEMGYKKIEPSNQKTDARYFFTFTKNIKGKEVKIDFIAVGSDKKGFYDMEKGKPDYWKDFTEGLSVTKKIFLGLSIETFSREIQEWLKIYNRDKDTIDKQALGLIPYLGPGILTNSGKFNGLSSEEAKQKITEFVGGRVTKQYHLRDWVVSRQRYWGVPIPMIYCPECALKGDGDGYNPVPQDQLPVILPEVDDYLPTGDGKSPLAKVRSWVEVPCPKCGGKGERETDTFDTFVDSSWYFLRYADPRNPEEFASREKIEKWMPVDLYSGGSEHTTMHVLYSRFWHKALYDAGLVTTSEPYTRRMNRSLIMGPDGQKMSKSKGNVIDPDEVVAAVGADAVRIYMAFIGPYNEVGAYPWNPNGVVGVRRFLERVWSMAEKVTDAPLNKDTEILLNQTIKKVGEDIASMKMNTAVSALMMLSNHLHDLPLVPNAAYEALLSLLHPFAPHLTSELLSRPPFSESSLAQWPAYDPEKVTSDRAVVAVQINGKVRGTLELSMDTSEGEAVSAAKGDPKIALWLLKATLVRVIYRPGKVLNFVVDPEKG